jgi:O-antigen/teichoic acid export membrane protein
MSETADLSQRSISAVFWGVSGSAVYLILQFGIQVVLARLLGPEQYGLFAIALVIITLSGYFATNVGFGLIQKRTVTDEDVRFVNFWQLAVGAVVATAVFLLADTVAGFFQEPRVAPLIRTMSAVCLIQAAAGPAAFLLNRDLDFKSIYVAGIAAYAFSYGLLGIPLALAGYGVSALVTALITQSLLTLAILYWRKRPVLGFVIWHRDAYALWSYGFTVFATNISNWALYNLSRAVVGRMFPSAAVGLYAMPYNLVMQLAGAVMGAVQPPLFSASSRVQDDVARLRPVFLTLLAVIVMLSAPLFVGIAVAPQTIMLALYGDEWAPSAPLLRAFALAIPFYLATGMATPMLWNSGRTTQEFKLQLPIAAALALATYLAARHSLEAAAWAVLGIFVLRFIVITTAVCIALELPFRQLATAFRAGIAITLLVAGAIALIDGLAAQMTAQRQVVLALDVATGFVVQVIALRLFRTWFSPEVRTLFEMLLARLPRSLAPFGESVLGASQAVTGAK